jgi:hypothetical protein
MERIYLTPCPLSCKERGNEIESGVPPSPLAEGLCPSALALRVGWLRAPLFRSPFGHGVLINAGKALAMLGHPFPLLLPSPLAAVLPGLSLVLVHG